jgi:ADP-glucose pyrophosphorylase
VEKVKNDLLNDENIKTGLLFISPRGNGLKWVIANKDITRENYTSYYQKVSDYTEIKYGLKADNGAKDISRATYLSYDPTAYLYPFDSENIYSWSIDTVSDFVEKNKSLLSEKTKEERYGKNWQKKILSKQKHKKSNQIMNHLLKMKM